MSNGVERVFSTYPFISTIHLKTPLYSSVIWIHGAEDKLTIGQGFGCIPFLQRWKVQMSWNSRVELSNNVERVFRHTLWFLPHTSNHTLLSRHIDEDVDLKVSYRSAKVSDAYLSSKAGIPKCRDIVASNPSNDVKRVFRFRPRSDSITHIPLTLKWSRRVRRSVYQLSIGQCIECMHSVFVEFVEKVPHSNELTSYRCILPFVAVSRQEYWFDVISSDCRHVRVDLTLVSSSQVPTREYIGGVVDVSQYFDMGSKHCISVPSRSVS
jgi:hypothetical protein